MGKIYKRIDSIDEKIHSVKLPYNAWKVLFLINENSTAESIADLLNEEKNTVEEALDRLLHEQMIETGEIDEQVPAPEPIEEDSDVPEMPEFSEPELEEDVETQEVAEETAEVEEKVEEISEEPEEILEEAATQPEETKVDLEETAEEILEEEVTKSLEPETTEDDEQAIEEIIQEEKLEPRELEPDESAAEAIIEDIQDEPEEPVVDEEVLGASLEESIEDSTDEEIEINISEDESIEIVDAETEKETESLDVDFAEPEIEEETLESDVAEPEVDEAPEVEQEEQVEEKEESTTEVATDTKTVLVVDDSIVIRKMVEIALEDEPLAIETAVSGKEGLNIIDNANPDIVILDLMLPDISGIDILKTIKASRGIPVIMLSGKDSPQMIENAKSEGADAFLPKPFKDEDLVDQIKSLLKI